MQTIDGARVSILGHLDLLHGGPDADHVDTLMDDLVAAVRADRDVDGARVSVLGHLDLLHGGPDADRMDDLMDDLVAAVRAAAPARSAAA
ncbi:hypothetical protein PV516_19125 [Streptomyces scabiei]|uniref:hypothetical protein n=1 Tax=Streptomyces scabiei TaxID=1930 RepID=UPI0029B7B9D0|nr:hypothetical protein [Streptomyces scabiei]MDX3165901.1 hypothetical protein [Streptomyces scabiei]